MERMMQQLDQNWPQLKGLFDSHFLDDGAFGKTSGGGYGPGSHISVQRTDDQGTRKLDLQVKEDGSVTAEVTIDGKTEKVEAKSFEDFRANHGQVLKDFGVGGGPRVLARREPGMGFGPPPGIGPRRAPVLGKGGRLQQTPDLEPRGKKLGVKVTPISEDLAAYLDLDEGVGLLVREVLDGTLAARMGIKRGDVVVTVDGEPATGTDVIARALARPDGAPLDVVVIRKGARVTLHGAS
jgi:hypothetical protein